ncbi:hypothetical protein COF64_20050 [Bacillus sp. AFS043905]|nr:hypothetical protein COF64_20050 [Bacillus sp. AFS043905]TWD93357.1 hypothetical protein FB545_5230 [Peribacillus frigoritolerans]
MQPAFKKLLNGLEIDWCLFLTLKTRGARLILRKREEFIFVNPLSLSEFNVYSENEFSRFHFILLVNNE